MYKKILSTALVVITLLSSMLIIPTHAASYQLGKYEVTTSSGVNVKPSPSSSSRYGAASKGTNFTVTKISGSYGYTQSIYCANGRTVSGWVCLDYCRFKGSSHTHNYSGSRYYNTAHPHAISVHCTCGSNKYTGEYYKVSGCSQCYPSSNKCVLTYNGNGGTNVPSSQSVNKNNSFTISGKIPTRSGYSFVGWATSKSGNASFYPNQTVSMSENTTLYAVWKSGSIKTSYSQPLTSGTKYYISPACAPNAVLDADGGNTYPGTNLQIWQKADVTNQQIEARYYGSGYYYFIDSNSGLAIDVSSGVPFDGQNVHFYTLNYSDAQLFRLISAGNGYYYIQSKLNPAYYLDVNGAHSANGTNVHLYTGNFSSAQKFKFTAVTNTSSQKYAAYTGINYENILRNALNSGKISTKEFNNRMSVLNKAKDMATVLWTSPVSFHTWKSSSGSYNSNRKMIYSGSTSTTSQFVKGVTYKGIPYAANAGSNKYDDKAWLSLVNSNSNKSCFEGKVTYLGSTRYQCTSKGVDCSGFVYNAYKTLSNYKAGYLATSGLLNSSYWKKISASSAQPGDILLKSGHVMIFVGKTSNGKISVLESTADGSNGFSGCRYYELSSISGYSYYKFTGIAK